MTKKVIEKDELWPVYYPAEPWGNEEEVEIPDKLIQEFDKVMKDFNEIQEKLRLYYKR